MASNGYKADDTKFSSPMPAIGLDIAGATLVCLLLMLCDIFNAIRQRKPWIPCQFFVLNSFTLTLLSVATKLPVDLTSSMPSSYDQLSKLCGTAFICISIGYLRPSIVNMNESELSANFTSLTIMVIIVVVNISLQMSTGAIFLFKVEHVITLVLMLLLLGVMGCLKFKFPDCFSEPFRKSLKHMPRNIHTLKRCYMFSYITNPQLMLCRLSPSATIGMICTVCCVVLLEAVIRTCSLDNGVKEASDYKWSIWAVVGLQILTVMVGTFAIVFRCLAFANQMHSVLFIAMKRNISIIECYNVFLLAQRNWSFYSGALNHSKLIFQIFRVLECILDSLLFLMRIWADCVNKLNLIVIWVAGDCFAWAMRKTGIISFGFLKDDGDDEEIMIMLRKEFEYGLEGCISSVPNFFSNYLLRKSIMEMEMCIKKHSTYPQCSLLKFLGRSAHGSMGLLKQISKSSDELLLLVCLVRMADSMAPSLRTASLVSAFDQAFEIIVFIHERTKTMTASNNLKINVAKDIWMSRGISNHWFQTDIIKHLKKGCTNHFLDPGRIVDKYLLTIVCHEVYDIINIIGEPRIFDVISSTNGHIEELYDHIEQLFVELLLSFIDQLPDVIFNSLNESIPTVEFQENVKISMKLVARLNLLEDEHLCFASSNINSFMTTDTTVKEHESRANVSLAIEDHADANLRLPTTHEDQITKIV